MTNNTAILLICIYAAVVEAHGVAVLVWAYRQHIKEVRHGK